MMHRCKFIVDVCVSQEKRRFWMYLTLPITPQAAVMIYSARLGSGMSAKGVEIVRVSYDVDALEYLLYLEDVDCESQRLFESEQRWYEVNGWQSEEMISDNPAPSGD